MSTNTNEVNHDNQEDTYSPEYKSEILKLADKVGATRAAKQLSLHESQI
ncbi:hypothetical protein BCU36_008825 [Vibrio lentus]